MQVAFPEGGFCLPKLHSEEPVTATLTTDNWDADRIRRLLAAIVPEDDPAYRPALALVTRCNTMPGAESTLARLRRFLRDFKRMGVHPLGATRNDLDDWVASLRGLSPETVSGLIGTARTFYEEAIDRELILRSPARRLSAGRYTPAQVPALTKSEAESLLAGIAAELSDPATRLAASRDTFIFATALLMGPRSSEMLRLEAGDLKLAGDPPVAQLFGKFRHHATKRVPVQVIDAYRLWTADLAAELKRELRPDDALLVALSHNGAKQMREQPDRRLVPMSKAALYNLVRERLRDAGISGAKLGPHRLRKTAATLMYEADVDVDTIRRTLDHSDISVTFRNYIIPAQNLKRAAGDEVGLKSPLDDRELGRE